MKRILVLVTQLERAGAQKVALALAAHRAARGDRVTFAYFYDKGAGTEGMLDGVAFETLDLEAKRPGAGWIENAGRAARGCLRLLARIASGGFDGVVTFTHYSNLLGIPMAWLCGVPRRLASQQNVLLDMPGWLTWLDALLVNAGIASRMVACSESVRDACVGDEGMVPGQVSVVPNWSEPPAARPPPEARVRLQTQVAGALGLAPDRQLLLAVGRLSAQKGYETLLRAAPRILAGAPRAVILIAGEGELRDRLEAQAEALELGPRLHFLGARPDVPELMDAATLLLHPTRWEGLPLVLLEAAHHELPIVTTQAPGTAAVIRDGETGRAVPVDDPEAFAAAVAALLADPARAAALAARAREHVRERFGAARCLAAWDALLGDAPTE